MTRILLTVTALLLVVTPPAAGQRVKQVHEVVVPLDSKESPATLEGMVRSADLVARVRIVATDASQMDLFAPGYPLLATVYQAHLAEVISKSLVVGVSAPGSMIRIVRPGGTVDKGTHIERTRTEGFDDMTLGGEYLLFLRWHARLGVFVPRWGPDGTFVIENGKVTSQGRSPLARQQVGESITTMTARLRAVAHRATSCDRSAADRNVSSELLRNIG